jgi:hypothetical protein
METLKKLPASTKAGRIQTVPKFAMTSAWSYARTENGRISIKAPKNQGQRRPISTTNRQLTWRRVQAGIAPTVLTQSSSIVLPRA